MWLKYLIKNTMKCFRLCKKADGAALIAAMETNRFYLRRYEPGLHVVITTGERILGQAFQGKADLVTQYHPEPIKQFAMARVVYKNESLG